MATASYASDPQVQYLVQILDEIGKGLIQVPRFQRPLVWEREQQLELLRSVRDGIPMGALMVWRTDMQIQCYPGLGSYRLAAPPEGALRQYLLDGVQRLSTLFAATRTPDADLQDPDIPVLKVAYDLESEDFVLLGDGSEPPANLLPLDLLLDSVKLLKFQRLIPLKKDDWVERSDRLARAFREYKIAVIPIVTNDLTMATRTFQRINSQGTAMGELHMIHALSWSGGFNLLERIEELKEQYLSPIGWQDCDDERIILPACKTALGLDIYRTTPDELSEAIRKDQSALESAVSGLAKAAAFLRARCFLPTPRMLPYGLQAVVIGEAFRGAEQPDERGLELLEAWFWLTMYNEFFFGLSGSRLGKTISDASAMVEDGIPRWSGNRVYSRKPLKPKFDFRHARAKGLALFMASRVPRMPDGQLVGVLELLASEPTEALGRMVPRRILGSRVAHASFGNRVLCPADSLASLRDTIAAESEDSQIALSHLVPPSAADLARAEDWALFINARATFISAEETKFAAFWEEKFSGADGFAPADVRSRIRTTEN